MPFHNLQHTLAVVEATTEIAGHSGISKSEINAVKIAAWFHDSGYCFVYKGHEEQSVKIAIEFLTERNCDEAIIRIVCDCIKATKMPQRPTGLLQQIICDADLAHFAKPGYWETSLRLKKEWEIQFGQKQTEAEWRQASIGVLIAHSYFTEYGKTVLQKQKLNNIDALLKAL